MKEVVVGRVGTSPLSGCIRAGDFVYTAGQIADNVNVGMGEQTKQVMDKLNNLLHAAGASMSDVVKATVFVTDLSKFAEMNAVYATYFSSDLPCRSTVECKLARAGALVEIELLAYAPKKK